VEEDRGPCRGENNALPIPRSIVFFEGNFGKTQWAAGKARRKAHEGGGGKTATVGGVISGQQKAKKKGIRGRLRANHGKEKKDAELDIRERMRDKSKKSRP